MKGLDFIKEILNNEENFEIKGTQQQLEIRDEKTIIKKESGALLYAVYVLEVKPVIIDGILQKIYAAAISNNIEDFRSWFKSEYEDLFLGKVKIDDESAEKIKKTMINIIKSNPLLIEWFNYVKIKLGIENDDLFDNFLDGLVTDFIRDVENDELSLSFEILRKNVKDVFEGEVIKFAFDEYFIKDIYLKYVASKAQNFKLYYDIILELTSTKKFGYYDEKKIKKKKGEDEPEIVRIGYLIVNSWVWGKKIITLGENITFSTISTEKEIVFKKLFDVDFDKILEEWNKFGKTKTIMNVSKISETTISEYIKRIENVVKTFFDPIEHVKIATILDLLEEEDKSFIYEDVFEEIRRKLLSEGIRNYSVRLYIVSKDRISSYVIIDENEDLLENLDRVGNINELYVFIRDDLDGIFFDKKNLEDFVKNYLRLKGHKVDKMDMRNVISKIFSNHRVKNFKKTSIYIYKRGYEKDDGDNKKKKKTYLGIREAVYVEFNDEDVVDIIDQIKKSIKNEL